MTQEEHPIGLHLHQTPCHIAFSLLGSISERVEGILLGM